METILIVMVGLPGSGKSTWAKEQKMKIHSSDAIRKELFGDESVLGDSDVVFETLYQRVILDLKQGYSVIFDATNLTVQKRSVILKRINSLAVKVRATVMKTPIEKCLQRNSGRARIVPEEVIYQMECQYQEPTLSEGFDQIEFINISR